MACNQVKGDPRKVNGDMSVHSPPECKAHRMWAHRPRSWYCGTHAHIIGGGVPSPKAVTATSVIWSRLATSP
eukprot:scaffold90956_cov69-Phaeocystis_antarctica.AAC.2